MRKHIFVVLAVAAMVAAIVAAALLQRRAAPKAARLLPEAEGYVYINLKPLRRAGVIGKGPLANSDPEYEQFVRETGFQFERDLDEAAFAVHVPPLPLEAGTTAQPDYRRYSEIFIGRIDAQRASAYLRKQAETVENYRGVEIYGIPLPGRTVRIALLGIGTAAVSNTDGPQVIRGMIDRYQKMALPFGGPELVRDYYRYVPLASSAWGMAQIVSHSNRLMLPGGLDLFFPRGTVLVGSARYLGSAQFQAEAFTSSPAQAKQIAEQFGAFLTVFRGLESTSASGTDPDVKALFESVKLEENNNRVALTASVPPGFLKKMFTDPAQELSAGAAAAPEPKAPPAQPARRKKR